MENTNGDARVLGFVEGGQFKRLGLRRDAGQVARLTSIAPQQSVPPESGELDLSEYEGSAIMVEGIDQRDWIFSARVIDVAGPILTAVARQVL